LAPVAASLRAAADKEPQGDKDRVGAGPEHTRGRQRSYIGKARIKRETVMAITDYDAPRRATVELGEDSLEELQARRATAQSPSVDLDEADAAEVFELPGADISDDELTVPVVPMQADEFRCTRCFLVHHRSQRATPGQDVCRDCA
jgi:hypothetical protein